MTDADSTAAIAAQFVARPTGMKAVLFGTGRFLVQKKLGTIGLLIVVVFVVMAVFMFLYTFIKGSVGLRSSCNRETT